MTLIRGAFPDILASPVLPSILTVPSFQPGDIVDGELIYISIRGPRPSLVRVSIILSRVRES